MQSEGNFRPGAAQLAGSALTSRLKDTSQTERKGSFSFSREKERALISGGERERLDFSSSAPALEHYILPLL